MDNLKVSGNYGRGSAVKDIFQNSVNEISFIVFFIQIL
jgi:hypothetical protein